jgi:hypothetical protein
MLEELRCWHYPRNIDDSTLKALTKLKDLHLSEDSEEEEEVLG